MLPQLNQLSKNEGQFVSQLQKHVPEGETDWWVNRRKELFLKEKNKRLQARLKRAENYPEQSQEQRQARMRLVEEIDRFIGNSGKLRQNLIKEMKECGKLDKKFNFQQPEE